VLLSLALVSTELGKFDAAARYITQAIRSHSGDPQVHYLAGYLALEGGNLEEAVAEARTALSLNPRYDPAEELLALALFRLARYDEALAVCDRRLAARQPAPSAWYLQARTLERLYRIAESLAAYAAALAAHPGDEILRGAAELALLAHPEEAAPVLRQRLVGYRLERAASFLGAYRPRKAEAECRLALRLDPDNAAARRLLSELALSEGRIEAYVAEMSRVVTPGREEERLSGYRALLKGNLASQWGIDPATLDRKRWQIGVYHRSAAAPLIHEGAEGVVAALLGDFLSATAFITAPVAVTPTPRVADAFRKARDASEDYFLLLDYEENDRELSLSGSLYSGRTGAEIKKVSAARSGNDRLLSALLYVAQEIDAALPVYGTILARRGDQVLIDLGRTEGLTEGAVLTVIRPGALKTRDTAPGMVYPAADTFATVTVEVVGEGIASGALTVLGYHDRVSLGDLAAPVTGAAPAPGTPAQNAPAPVPSAPIYEAAAEPKTPVQITAAGGASSRIPMVLGLLRTIW
jgi:tetratricopeptide (TPR) repeat protein